MEEFEEERRKGIELINEDYSERLSAKQAREFQKRRLDALCPRIRILGIPLWRKHSWNRIKVQCLMCGHHKMSAAQCCTMVGPHTHVTFRCGHRGIFTETEISEFRTDKIESMLCFLCWVTGQGVRLDASSGLFSSEGVIDLTSMGIAYQQTYDELFGDEGD